MIQAKHMIAIFLIGSIGCEFSLKSTTDYYNSDRYKDLPYDLSKPHSVLPLHYDLREISGLSYLSETQLACVQDESGTVFKVNSQTGKIEDLIKFGPSGDYEGIEVVNESIYVINSKGDLYKFARNAQGNTKAIMIETSLSSINNVEGLGFDQSNGNLLIACKGAPEIKGKKIKGKAIYGYSLANSQITGNPELTITRKQISAQLPENVEARFAPSGIAMNPVDNHLYIISSVGKIMVVVDNKGAVRNVYQLNPAQFPQPEGICFDPLGNLFIATEGRGSRGKILMFRLKNANED